MEQRRSAPKKYAGDSLKNYALRVLGVRSVTLAELKKKLAARAEDPSEVPALITMLQESKLLDDERFAESFSNSRRDQRLFGPQRVRRELAQRQVPKSIAESAVKEAFGEVDEVAQALAHLERKIRVPDPVAHFKDPKNLQSAFRKLVYAGFSPGAASKALKRFSSEADELADFDPSED